MKSGLLLDIPATSSIVMLSAINVVPHKKPGMRKEEQR